MQRHILSIILLILCSSVSIAQEASLFDKYYATADSLYDAYSETEAIVWASKAAEEAKKNNQIQNEVKALLLKSICQAYINQGPQAKETINEILTSKIGLADSTLRSAILHRKGVLHYILGEYQMSSQAYEEALKIRAILLPKEHPDYQNTAFNLGVNLFQSNQYYSSKNQFEDLLKTVEKDTKNEYFVKVLFELAKVYREIGDYERSENCFQKLLNINYETSTLSAEEICNIYTSMAIGKSDQEKYKEALIYYDSAIVHIDQSSSLSTGNVQNNVGGAWYQLGEYEKAIDYYQQAIQSYGNPNQIQLARGYTNMGLAYAEMNNFERSYKYVFEGLKKAESYHSENHPDLAIYDRNIAVYFQRKNQLDSALKYTVSAIDRIAPTYNVDMSNNIFDERILNGPIDRLSELIVEKIRIKYEQWASNPDPEPTAIMGYLAELKWAEKLLNTWTVAQQSTLSKLYWRRKATNLYAFGLKLCLQAQELELNSHPLSYEFFETSKNMLLQQQINSREAKSLSGVNASLLTKELNLQSDIQALQNSIFFGTEMDSEKLSDSLFDKNEDLISLRENIRRQYPAYEAIEKKSSTVPLSQIQLKLKPSERMLQYHASDSGIYLLDISTNSRRLFDLGDPIRINTLIGQYLSLIKEIPSSPILYKQHISQLEKNLHLLYQILVPFELTKSESLVIVPDGLIGYVSFHTLLDSESKGFELKSWPYLWKNHSISYNYSGSLWHHKDENPRVRNKGGVAIGPQFDKQIIYPDAKSFTPLKYNFEESNEIAAQWNLKSITGSDATKANSIKHFNNAQIIHLASHATINEENNAFSYIAFSHDHRNSDNSLFLGELAQLGIQADMIVLSACETGIGKNQLGEGINSIARGFYGAGAKSILASLWQVNDKSTKEMMGSFYSGLEKKETKDDAWRNAVETYFAEHDNFQCHPYFWGGFLPLGDMTSIERHNSMKNFFLLGGLFFIMVIIFLFVRYFKKKSSNRPWP